MKHASPQNSFRPNFLAPTRTAPVRLIVGANVTRMKTHLCI